MSCVRVSRGMSIPPICPTLKGGAMLLSVLGENQPTHASLKGYPLGFSRCINGLVEGPGHGLYLVPVRMAT